MPELNSWHLKAPCHWFKGLCHHHVPVTHFTEFMSSYLKIYKSSLGFNCNFDDTIRSQICTCHDSWAVVKCTKLWPDYIIIFQERGIWIWFGLWAHNSLQTPCSSNIDMIPRRYHHHDAPCSSNVEMIPRRYHHHDGSREGWVSVSRLIHGTCQQHPNTLHWKHGRAALMRNFLIFWSCVLYGWIIARNN